MSKTYLQFSAGRDAIAWIICQKTGSRYSHVDFVLPSGELLGALPGGGVQIRPPRKYWRSQLYEIPVANGWEYATTQLGRPYDYHAVLALGLPFPRQWQKENAWFCSEIAYISIKKAGLSLLNESFWGVTPRDLLLSPWLKPI